MHLTSIHLEVTPFFGLLLHSFEREHVSIVSYFSVLTPLGGDALCLFVGKNISECLRIFFMRGHRTYVEAMLERWNLASSVMIMVSYVKYKLWLCRLECQYGTSSGSVNHNILFIWYGKAAFSGFLYSAIHSSLGVLLTILTTPSVIITIYCKFWRFDTDLFQQSGRYASSMDTHHRWTK